MERALWGLTLRDASVLLACLVRFLRLHAASGVPSSTLDSADYLLPTGTHKVNKGMEEEEEEGEEAGRAIRMKRRKVPPVSSTDSPATQDCSFPLPPLYAVLDWLRLLIDAHYPSLVLQGQLQASKEAKEGVASPRDSLLGHFKQASKALASQAAFAASAAGLRGQLEHILRRLPLPQPPAPEYIVEKITL